MSGTACQLFEHASLAPACFAARLGQTVRGGIFSLRLCGLADWATDTIPPGTMNGLA